MPYETLELNRSNGVCTLSFNRPERYNALNHTMAAELLKALEEIQGDGETRALLLTGNGPAFHAGGDVKQFAEWGPGASEKIDQLLGTFHQAVTRLIRMPVPTVAAVNGVSAGAGFSLAMACDMVLAEPQAVFSAAYSGIGASPDGGMTYLLMRLVGLRRAMELYYTNRRLSAAEALEWGLVTRVTGAGEALMDSAVELARQLAEGPTLAYGRARELLIHSLDHTLEEQLEREGRHIVACAGSEDFQEGVRAFTEKRKAVFKGR